VNKGGVRRTVKQETCYISKNESSALNKTMIERPSMVWKAAPAGYSARGVTWRLPDIRARGARDKGQWSVQGQYSNQFAVRSIVLYRTIANSSTFTISTVKLTRR